MTARLAAIGIYGVTANAAAQQPQEIGVRLLLAEGAGLLLAGIVVGLAGALARLIASRLFGVAPTDPPTLAAGTNVPGLPSNQACSKSSV